MPNRLTQESSPYLRQHAENPVEWYPWGDEAFTAAQEQNKPILLSIGYSACHWCHVMAHESFEDEDTADFMNQWFINVKVDREERPDVDQIYMSAVMAMRGQGGWPLTAALTPEGKPFFGGTYFPKEPRHGLPSFQQVLVALAKTWELQEEKVRGGADEITEQLQGGLLLKEQGGDIDKGLFNRALQQLGTSFDQRWGGFGRAPKFPQAMVLEFVLRGAMATGDEKVLHMLTHTLTMMARGGIYDQLGGGFARYSTDNQWLVPHFEKMLYDNAQLAKVYTHTWQVTGNPFFRRIAEETIDFVLREMTHQQGGFYSSYDADSEGEEGKFYVWSLAEVEEILGVEDAQLLALYYDLSANGNWEGHNIPNLARAPQDVAQMVGLTVPELEQKVFALRDRLYGVRTQREWPGLDDKILTSWNGLMLGAIAEAGRIFNRPDYLQAAVKNATFLYQTMRTPAGRLLRTWKAGLEAKYNGYLEDYAFLAEGLLALYQATFDEQWFVWAQELAEQMLTHFADPTGGFFDTSDDHEALIFRPKDVQDNAIPSGNSVAATVLLQLSLYTGKGEYWDTAGEAISGMYGPMAQYPSGFGQWLTAATLLTLSPQEIALVGDLQSDSMQKMLAELNQSYRPYQVVAAGPSDHSVIPLLQNRPVKDNLATAYVCRHFACHAPITDPAEMVKLL